MIFNCKINKPLSTRNNKKYLELTLSEKDSKKVISEHSRTKNLIQNSKIKDPLDGNVLEVKVPFRYRKVTCNVEGNKTIHELKENDQVTVTLKYCGVWNIGEYSGFAWRLDKLVN